MSLLLLAALSVSAPVQPSCSWDRPGVNPFMGDVVAAVDRYQDIPAAARAALKRRIAARQYDEIATISREGIAGAYRYDNLRDMHFGKGTICRTVTRERWTPTTQERGLVYCEDSHCLIVPTVCRNVSRVDRASAKQAAASGPQGPSQPAPTSAQAEPLAAPLAFDPPSAGDGRSLAASGSDDVPGSSLGSVEVGGGELDGGGPSFADGLRLLPGGFPALLSPMGPSFGGTAGTGGDGAGRSLPGVPGIPGVPGVPGVPASPVADDPSGGGGVGGGGSTAGLPGSPGMAGDSETPFALPTPGPSIVPDLAVTTIPEPHAGGLALIGLAALGVLRRIRRGRAR
jgi:MYXO-CTERM domain-containing protein